MAIFKPEVRTVEGSNVGTYNPPTVDYSGFYSGIGRSIGSSISSMFDASGGKSGNSEGDKEMIALQDVTSQWQRASEIEDPTVRSVTLKNIQKNAYLEYPKYREGIKGIFSELSGFIYEGTGADPDQLVQASTYKWATSTSEGQSAAVVAQMKSGGDPLLQDQYIKDAYLQDLSYKNQVAATEQEAKLMEADDKKRKILFGTNVRPLLQGKIDSSFAQDISKEVVDRLRQEARTNNLDEVTFLIDSLTTTRNQRLAEVTNEINRMGLDPTTINPDSFMAGYDSTLKRLTQNKDLISRSMQTMTENQKAQVSSIIRDPSLRSAYNKDNPFVLSELLLQPENKADLAKVSELSIGIAGNGMTPNVSETSLGTEDIGDSPRRFAEVYKGMAPEEELMKIFNAPRDTKIALGKLGINSIRTYKNDPTMPEKTEAAYRNIGAMYVTALPSIDVEGSSYKSANVRNLIGDMAFTTIDSIKSTNPNLGNDLYNKMNTYAANAVKKLTDSFNVNMDVIKDTEFSPFILEMDKNGNLALNVNSDALNSDINLKKAMGAYRYETKGSGRSVKTVGVEMLPTETDPMKILSNYVSITEGANSREIMDIIQSLKILASQSKKIPPDIRSKIDPIEIIKQNVTVLGK
tara:strand:- start:10810 stop:12711 length:1902 start_codon:yes stop_codon:yes gene_type:complete